MPPAVPVAIQACALEAPSVPPWFAELILLAQHFTQRGLLDALAQHLQLRRGRAGRYEVIDFVAILLGYACSGEPTLGAFFARLGPFAGPFMALFGRSQLPHRSSLSRFLAAIDRPCLSALREQFAHDLCRHGAGGDLLGGLSDHQGHRLLVFDIDGTRQAARQRALVAPPAYPPPRRRMARVCAPGHLGRKRGEVVRTRTTVLQAHTQQWLGTFSGAGNGDYSGELLAACQVIVAYLQAKGLRPAQALLRLDALYGTATPLAHIQRAGLGFLARGRDYQLLRHPLVQARLQHPADVRLQHPATQAQRELFDAGYLADWLEPTPALALTCRVIVVRQAAHGRAEEGGCGKRVGAYVYELFLTSAPASCLRADEVLDLYHQRGAFERVLSEEDVEQDPDRWCSHTPDGQEFWQVLSQWVWNTRLELGMAREDCGLRRTCWSAAVPAPAQPQPVPPAGGPGTPAHEGRAACVSYGPPEVARAWGRASGRLAGEAFTVLADGTLRCPAGKALRPQERRPEADGTLRIVYRARQQDCRACIHAAACLGPRAAGTGIQPRRVSAVCRRIAEPAGECAALLHEDVPADLARVHADLLWCDLPASGIRRGYIAWARRQRVSIVTLHAPPPTPGAAGAPRLWTRAERAHRRLSWAARLARNAWAAQSSRYACTVFGVGPALATFLGLAPDPP